MVRYFMMEDDSNLRGIPVIVPQFLEYIMKQCKKFDINMYWNLYKFEELR
jgi:hypothetical protein